MSENTTPTPRSLSEGPPPPPAVWSIDVQTGEMIGFPAYPPGDLVWTCPPVRDPSQWTKIHVHVDEDGRPRVVLSEYHDGFRQVPGQGHGLATLERELLDGLARIIARDILRQRDGR